MVLAAVLALAGRGLAAQHAGQWEAGAFSSYTSYDPAFGLAQKVGAGIRVGYLVGDVVGVEGDLLFQPEFTTTAGSGTPVIMQPLIASASLVLNAVHLERVMVYALGGYTLLDFGTRAPYRFTDNAAHGGAGVRLFLSERIALRLEGRAIYTVSTKSTFGPTTPKHYVATLGLSVFHLGAAPAAPKPKSLCPNPPPGATLDAKGCPIDSDGDGVPDGIDQCPNTPPGTKVDAVGCPLPIEAVKPLPPPPAPVAAPAAPPKCPPPPPGSQVDANGCLVLFTPEAARPAVPGAPPRPTLILTGVNFETARSALTRDSYVVLDAVAASLLANPDIRIEIGGYTDSTGTKFGNFRLSQSRAAAVRFYLARKGVPPTRMVSKGYGASGYVAPNSTAAGRAQNRRVELHKLP